MGRLQDGRRAEFPDILAPFMPTPHEVVERMLRLAAVTSKDMVYDLGCGDGRIPIAAARDFGARGVGFDIEPYRVAESHANAKKAGVEHLVEFRLQDAQTVDLSPASVVTLYLVQWSMLRLAPYWKLPSGPARASSRSHSIWESGRRSRLSASSTRREMSAPCSSGPWTPRQPRNLAKPGYDRESLAMRDGRHFMRRLRAEGGEHSGRRHDRHPERRT